MTLHMFRWGSYKVSLAEDDQEQPSPTKQKSLKGHLVNRLREAYFLVLCMLYFEALMLAIRLDLP